MPKITLKHNPGKIISSDYIKNILKKYHTISVIVWVLEICDDASH